MIPVDFLQRNLVLKKPSNMTDEQCVELPVCKTQDTDGFSIMVSKWQLSKEDLEEIQNTGCIWLTVTGDRHPPVGVSIQNPFQ